MKSDRRSSSVVTSNDNITIVRWANKKIVHTISSFAGLEPQDKAQRWDGKAKKYIDVQRPFAISTYNKFMGGVDMSDRMVAHYPHAFKNKKFYLRIFFHFVNVSLVNAWILFKQKTGSDSSFLEFKSDVADSLLILNKRRAVGRPSLSTPPEPLKKRARYGCSTDLRMDGNQHWPMNKEMKNALNCRYKNCIRRTRFFCKTCETPVCPECMEPFHQVL